MRSKILCLEDDATIQALVKESLREFHVVCVSRVQDAEVEIAKTEFEALLLDIELPDGDGLKFYSRISQDQKLSRIPAVFITGNSEIANKIMAFSVGAEDYITKPFDPRELSARLNSKIRKNRADQTSKQLRHVGDLEIDFDRQRVVHLRDGGEKVLELTGIEMRILALFSKRLEQVFSREQILNSVWGETHITDRTVDSHIAHLRTKIAGSLVSIETVKNLGYRAIVRSSISAKRN